MPTMHGLERHVNCPTRVVDGARVRLVKGA